VRGAARLGFRSQRLVVVGSAAFTGLVSIIDSHLDRARDGRYTGPLRRTADASSDQPG
jgi:hypothetical protein